MWHVTLENRKSLSKYNQEITNGSTWAGKKIHCEKCRRVLWRSCLHSDGARGWPRYAWVTSPCLALLWPHIFSGVIPRARYVCFMQIYHPRWPAQCVSVQIRKRQVKVALTFSDKVAEESRGSRRRRDVALRAERLRPHVFLLVICVFD